MTNFPQEIKKDLDLINEVCKDLKMKLFVVGGMPRDLIMGNPLSEKTDIDVTEKNGNAFELSFFVAAKYNLPEPVIYESSGSALLVMESGRSVEFHNAFYNVPHIVDELYRLDVEPTPINKDVYSRDFTINTLLMDIETEEILDITGNGIKDIEERTPRTPLNPMKSLSINPKNILRGIRFECQFGLNGTEEYELAMEKYVPIVIDFMKNHPNSEMLRSTIEKCFLYDPEKAYREFSRLGMTPYIPENLDFKKYIKNKYLGLNIVKDASVKTAQTKMIQRLLNERENHKAYLKRKKREKSQEWKKRRDILNKVDSGYYMDNPEEMWVSRRKNKNNIRRAPGYEFIKHPR